ncbi:uncharacterized protein LOC106180397 isoform X2 [Lingula anatina]|uniref:Uncharacterized protein LOC106180397 isoform X2 n=1 Tax=Lingula anatina TaxID=7574 RepID=A0A1S3KC48_LINAN|nr:uncharacterized protein LOC106180397 isoform X2 [Lingula anatina]|eukprot:XP_013419831.1 uncharacterized protein LOC106180397 isoform X2 [Lingula anatina]
MYKPWRLWFLQLLLIIFVRISEAGTYYRYLDNYLSHCSDQETVYSSDTYYLDPTYFSFSYYSSAPTSCYMRFYSSSSSYGLSAYVYSISMSSCTPYVRIYDGYSSSSSSLRRVSCTSTSSGTYYSTGRYLYVYYYRGYTTGHNFRIRIQRGSYLSSGYTCYSCTSCSGTGGSTTSCSYGCYKTVTTYSGYQVISKGCLTSSSVSNGCVKSNYLVEYEYCYCRSSYCNAAQVTRSGMFRPLGIAGLIISFFQYMHV